MKVASNARQEAKLAASGKKMRFVTPIGKVNLHVTKILEWPGLYSVQYGMVMVV